MLNRLSAWFTNPDDLSPSPPLLIAACVASLAAGASLAYAATALHYEGEAAFLDVCQLPPDPVGGFIILDEAARRAAASL